MNHKTIVLDVKTSSRYEMVNVTSQIKKVVDESHITHGLITLFVPHTTAAITINENADPDVKRDIILGLQYISPNRDDYRHYEGNSDAHLKSSIIGVDQTIIVEEGRLLLGTWQGIYFCEFDGPRDRKLYVRISE